MAWGSRRQRSKVVPLSAAACAALVGCHHCWSALPRQLPTTRSDLAASSSAGAPGCAARVGRAAASAEAPAEDDGELPRRVLLGATGSIVVLAGLKKFAINGPDEFKVAPGSLVGKTIVITGGNTGLGKESAARLAAGGATVVITARSDEKGAQAVKDIKQASGSGDVHYLLLDLADLQSVKSFPDRFKMQRYGSKIDVLMNNAGVMAIPTRQETKDGFERQFGVNHLGHFALTAVLLPLLRSAEGTSRVINLSSTAQLGATREQFEGDMMGPAKYTQWGAYLQSKLANVLFTKELDRRLKAAGVQTTAVACHPGAVDTDLARWIAGSDDPSVMKQGRKENALVEALTTFVTRSVPLGANTQVYLAAGADGGYSSSGGEYFDNMAPGLLNPLAGDAELARRLWAESERLTGTQFGL